MFDKHWALVENPLENQQTKFRLKKEQYDMSNNRYLKLDVKMNCLNCDMEQGENRYVFVKFVVPGDALMR